MALILANEAYRHETRLRNPVNDARLLADVLRGTHAFEVTLAVNLTRADMMRQLAKFKEAAAGADAAVIYYAGHGLSNSRRQNFLIPVDMSRIGNGARVDVDAELEIAAVSEDKLVEAVEGAALQFIALDACRTNAFAPLSRTSVRGLARRPDQSRKRLIFYATDEGKVAEDGAGSNSVFAASLARHMKNQQASIVRVVESVARDVEKSTNGLQSPTWSGNLRSDMYWTRVETPAEPEGAPALDADDRAYSAAVAANTSFAYVTYLQEFPNGKNAPAARVLLSTLSPAGPSATPATSGTSTAARRPSVLAASLAGTTIKDCDICPEMVVLPTGRFMRGSLATEPGRRENEPTPHEVAIGYHLAVSKFEITRRQWYAVMGGEQKSLGSFFSFCDDDCPMTDISLNDAGKFLARLNARTDGKFRYRLLTEAEWEFAARGGTADTFATGAEINSRLANIDGRKAVGDGQWIGSTTKVGSYPPNAFGLYDMAGNAQEWVSDTYVENVNDAPRDGRAVTDPRPGVGTRVTKGGSWLGTSADARTAARRYDAPGAASNIYGLRICRELR